MRVPSKILSVIVLTFGLVGVASAQQLTRAQTAQGFMAYGMPAQLANDVAALARQTSGITLDDGSGTSVSILNVSQPSNTSATFIAGGAEPTNPFGAYLGLAGGGSSLAGVNGTPGGAILSSSIATGARLSLSAPATDGNIDMATGGSVRWSLNQFGTILQAASGNDIVFSLNSGIRDFQTSIAAAGATQGTATAITARVQLVTGASGANGVILPASPIAGQKQTVVNTAAAIMLVYPGTGDQINLLGANTGASIAANAIAYCEASSASQWYCSEAPGA